MPKTGDKNQEPKNEFTGKQVFKTTAKKIDTAISSMHLKTGKKTGIAEFIDKAVDAYVEKQKLSVIS